MTSPAFDAAMLVLYRHSMRHVHLTNHDVAAGTGNAVTTVSIALNKAARLGYVERIAIHQGRAGGHVRWRLLVLGREFCQQQLGEKP